MENNGTITNDEPKTWPDLAGNLYDKLTGRNATISYMFENMEVDVPSSVGSSESAKWKLNGTVKITTSEN
jgi:hypothetical protein